MILDRIENIEKYKNCVPHLTAGMEFLKKASDLPVGRYDFEGGYALVQEGVTSPLEGQQFETHKKYIDIQYMVKQQEVLEWNTKWNLNLVQEYDPQKDVVYYQGQGIRITVPAGYFHIHFPTDAHRALCHVEQPMSYRKITMKFQVEE